ncbi:putative lipid II flippase FtsW [Wohlfahrtiimonas larvae]|uniref:Probable peptidoglycan glycosyltransferase FtsW n=1 Tax=Wohlfahrtiimonas larvae TaxID=1157986 RepID=A0ABP9MPZ0_9GAMM|nr:putative lipid II flippase FtsW [Wohlfahrtiimonas larvae]
MFKESFNPNTKVHLDAWLLSVVSVLLMIGILMVTSASSFTAEKYGVGIYHYSIRQMIYIAMGTLFGLFAFNLSLKAWYEISGKVLYWLAALMLILVLIPGIGREINGAMRWIPLGIINFQPSEMAKLFAFIYIAGFLSRHNDKIKHEMLYLITPLSALGILGVFLLLEPDFGSTAVLMGVGMAMIFIAGVSAWRFSIMILLTAVGMVSLVVLAPYRVARLKTFLDPWEYQFGEGFQLINSLMAIGRGELMGTGIGESIQKLGYLPEAHTDFIFAVYAEETGLLGVTFLIFLFLVLISRAFMIGKRAEFCGNMRFGAYLSYGIGLWIVGQAFINLAVAMGRLPTKGLTLPLLSYGGSSMITFLIAIGILFRIDIDSKHELQKITEKAKLNESETANC